MGRIPHRIDYFFVIYPLITPKLCFMAHTSKSDRKKSEYLLLQGPGSRWREFLNAFNIMLEFIKGFRHLHFIGPSITVFGSARFKEDHPFYKLATSFGSEIAQRGFTVMTGGGPGIMEAANRGAKEANGRSVGCNIILPMEQHHNPYLDIMIEMEHFYIRKVLLLKYSYAFVVFPGGFGTMDELFETLTLIQTKKIEHFPVVLFGREYWTNLLEQVEDMSMAGTISPGDTQLFLVTDSVEEGMQYILDRLKEKYGSEVKPYKIRQKWWLREKMPAPKKYAVIKLD